MIGNVWQWLETPIHPFPGFEVHPCYDDFTTPTFDDRHNLIKGGSWISCGNEAAPVSRYAFRRHFFQHAGFRYVVSDAPAGRPASHYETDHLVSEYIEFHYGAEYYGVPNFPLTLARMAISAKGNKPAGKALDLGCATGRASSNWPAISTKSPASISRPVSSASVHNSLIRAGSATPWSTKANCSATRNAAWPSTVWQASPARSSSSRVMLAISSPSSPATT